MKNRKKSKNIKKSLSDANIEQLITNDFVNEIQDILIYQIEDGSYWLFDRYNISKTFNGYLVKKIGGINDLLFGNIKNAVCWCISDKRKMYVRCLRIIELDRSLISTETELMIHQRLSKRYSDSSRSNEMIISLNKLLDDQFKRSLIVNELNKYIEDSNQWQLKKFRPKYTI